jgi:hypothetical protein
MTRRTYAAGVAILVTLLLSSALGVEWVDVGGNLNPAVNPQRVTAPAPVAAGNTVTAGQVSPNQGGSPELGMPSPLEYVYIDPGLYSIFTYPWYGEAGGMRWQSLYTKDLIGRPGTIHEMAVFKSYYPTYYNGTFPNVTLKLCHTTVTVLSSNLSSNYGDNTPVKVFHASSLQRGYTNGSNTWGWDTIDFTTDFNYDNSNNLLVEVTWQGSASGYSCTWGTYNSSGALGAYYYGDSLGNSGSTYYYKFNTRIGFVAGPVTVTSPNGGETWYVGAVYDITWTETNVVADSIYYSTDNGTTWIGLHYDGTPQTSYAWIVPNTLTTQALVKVVAWNSDGDRVEDVSDAVFTILGGAPAGSEYVYIDPGLYSIWSYPWYGDAGSMRWQSLYPKDLIGRAGTIHQMAVFKDYYPDYYKGTFPNVTVKLCNTTVTSLGSSFKGNYGDDEPVNVFHASSLQRGNGSGTYMWDTIDFDTDFDYDNTKNLLVEVTWAGSASGYVYTWGSYVSSSLMAYYPGGDTTSDFAYTSNYLINTRIGFVTPPGWTKRASVLGTPPEGAGGWLAYNPFDGLIYAARGEETGDFYSYDQLTNLWTPLLPSVQPVPQGNQWVLPSYGCRGVVDDHGDIYMTFGNKTDKFLLYSAGAWTYLPDVPNKIYKGTDAVFADGCVYLLDGFNSKLRRYDPSAASPWSDLGSLPGGGNLGWTEGSWLVFDGYQTLYAHRKARNSGPYYNEMWAFDLGSQTWGSSALPGMTGSAVGAGSAAAWFNSSIPGVTGIRALRGNNTKDFSLYVPAQHAWQTLPSIGGKVGVGGDITAAACKLFAFRGSSTNELWRYVPDQVTGLYAGVGSETTSPVGVGTMDLLPNPANGRSTVVQYALPKVGPLRLSLLDVSGRVVMTRDVSANSRAGALSIDLGGLSAGVYLVRITGADLTISRKLVVQR